MVDDDQHYQRCRTACGALFREALTVEGPKMAEDDTLNGRIRAILRDVESIEERRMFGGLCFLHNGHMLCGYDRPARSGRPSRKPSTVPLIRLRPHHDLSVAVGIDGDRQNHRPTAHLTILDVLLLPDGPVDGDLDRLAARGAVNDLAVGARLPPPNVASRVSRRNRGAPRRS